MDNPREGDRQVFVDFAAYSGAARFEACALLPANTVDRLGNDRHDYATLLGFEAARAAEGFRERHGRCAPAERRYVKAALHRRAINFRIRQRRYDDLFGSSFEGALHPSIQIDGAIEARAALRRLMNELTEDDFAFLVQVGMEDGRLASLFDDEGKRRVAAKRLKRLRCRALAILREFFVPEMLGSSD